MLHLSEFVWTLPSSVLVVFNNFLFIDATDRSKIRNDQKRFFIALSLYPLSFFANTPFEKLHIEKLPLRKFSLGKSPLRKGLSEKPNTGDTLKEIVRIKHFPIYIFQIIDQIKMVHVVNHACFFFK